MIKLAICKVVKIVTVMRMKSANQKLLTSLPLPNQLLSRRPEKHPPINQLVTTKVKKALTVNRPSLSLNVLSL